MKLKQNDYDEFLEKYAGFSNYQKLLFAITALISIGTSTLSQISIYASATPNYRCLIPELENCSLTDDDIKNLTIPYKNQKYETCYQYDLNVSSCNNVESVTPSTEVISCTNGYHYDCELYGPTTITTWNLVCDRGILSAVATSLFFAGYFLGSWTYGPLSDWYGRKLPMLVYSLSYIVFAVSLAFIPIFEVYVVLNVFAGAACIAAFMAVFTYVNEITPKKYQNLITFSCFQAAAIGHAVLPGLAYAFKDWRLLQLVCGVLPVLFVPFYLYLVESPRWLIAIGRHEEAKKIVTKFTKSNRKSFSDAEWDVMIAAETAKKKVAADDVKKEKQKYSVIDVFKPQRMRIVSVAVIFNWFAVSMVFYGLALNIGNLSGDPYVNGAINAGIEFVGIGLVLLSPFVEKRLLLAYSFLFCGLLCLASTVCIELAGQNDALSTAAVALAIIGKLVITGAFAITYSCTTDIFPTVIRGTGMSLGSMAARVGSMITPFTIELQKDIPWLTQTIFGIVSVLAFFTAIVLPKMTQDQTCLTSFQEAENFYKESMTVWNKITRFSGVEKNQSNNQDQKEGDKTRL